jgi:hypothetical protein
MADGATNLTYSSLVAARGHIQACRGRGDATEDDEERLSTTLAAASKVECGWDALGDALRRIQLHGDLM